MFKKALLVLAGSLLLAGALNAQAKTPDVFKVKFETSVGEFVVEVHPDWAPLGAEQFRKLVAATYFDECRFFRVLPGFVVQWGLNGDPAVTANWRDKKINDDPVKETNSKGTIVFATAGPNTRSTQFFINFGNNARLDGMGFAPFGKVISGMEVVEKINAEYGQSPDQGEITNNGNAYLKKAFPRLDYIKKASIVP